jgi:hypothetical protein
VVRFNTLWGVQRDDDDNDGWLFDLVKLKLCMRTQKEKGGGKEVSFLDRLCQQLSTLLLLSMHQPREFLVVVIIVDQVLTRHNTTQSFFV